jgi:antitoxin VapB
MIHLSHRTESLARRLAAARGISVEEAVNLAIEESSKEISLPAAADNKLTKDELIRRMEEISARCGARPLIDPRSPDGLLGYDDYGLPG